METRFDPYKIRESFIDFLQEGKFKKVYICFRPKDIKFDESNVFLTDAVSHHHVRIGDGNFYNVKNGWLGKHKEPNMNWFNWLFFPQGFMPLAFFELTGKIGSVTVKETFCVCGVYGGIDQYGNINLAPLVDRNEKIIPVLWAKGLQVVDSLLE